jgi:hypothetical protein
MGLTPPSKLLLRRMTAFGANRKHAALQPNFR